MSEQVRSLSEIAKAVDRLARECDMLAVEVGLAADAPSQQDRKDAARYRLLRALLRDVRWNDCTPALAVLRPDPDDAQTKYIDDVILDHALDAASHTRRLLVRQPEGR